MTGFLLLSVICTVSLTSASVIGRYSDEPVHDFVFASNGMLALVTEGSIELYKSPSLEQLGRIDAPGLKESVGLSVHLLQFRSVFILRGPLADDLLYP